MSEKKNVLLQGDMAVVEGGMAAGAEFFAGYPITPASEVAEGFAEELPKVGGKFIQMEDELAGIACAIGGSLSGKKSITATSGPGFSLKQENLGLGIMIEAPLVVVDVQRVGPSTGLPTSPSQGDVMQAKWGTHGDHPIIALSPSSVKETYELTIKAFDLTEKYRQPVILLLDEIVGHMREKIEIPNREDIESVDRKRPKGDKENFNPYEFTEDHVPPMPDYGTGYKYHTTGLFHDKTGFPRGTSEDAKRLMDRFSAKLEENKDEIIIYDEDIREKDKTVVISYGSTVRSAISAVNEAREKGIKAGWLKLKTIWPFAGEKIEEIAKKADKIIVPELNQGQLIREVERHVKGKAKVVGINRYDGSLIKPEHVMEELKEVK